MKRILITGAAGRIGQVLREGLRDTNTILRLCDITELSEPQKNEEIVNADVSDFSSMDHAMKNVDCVVHLAGIPTEAPWENLSAINIDGTYNIFETARRNNVKRIVFASSNHTVGFYRLPNEIDNNVLPRPDTLYGVTKVFGEALGRFYVDKYNLSVACIRIGSFEERPCEERHLRTWISHRDLVQLVHKCIIAPEFNYLTIYGVSANSRKKWDNDEVAKFLNYHPQDNAEDFVSGINIQKLQSDGVYNEFHGGPFCAIGFGEKLV